MLLCGIHDVEVGHVLGAPVMDPRTPGHDLLRSGVELDASLITSLKKRGVMQVWIEDDLARDLDAAVAPQLSAARLEVYSKLRDGLAACSQGKLVVASLQSYRQAVMGLVSEAVSSAKYASLTDGLFGNPEQASHGANVAFLSLLTGLHLERYLLMEQPRLEREQARDPAVLGLAGMLHDVGKMRLHPKVSAYHETYALEGKGGPRRIGGGDDDREGKPAAEEPEEYMEHVAMGKTLLEHARVPARVTNAVLNHHQRFNGLGWPDMTPYTAGRITGPLVGRRIHVFARIVAAANVLDNLMRTAEGASRPPVVALSMFASRKFEGWFDPVVRRAVLLRIPPFAIGTDVRLNDGRRAVVVSLNPDHPCRPVVRVIDEGKESKDAAVCDLQAMRSLSITHSLGEDVGGYLYEAPPAPVVGPDTEHVMIRVA